MTKNVLNKFLIFNLIVMGIAFLASPAYAEKNCPEGQEYFFWGQKCLPKCRTGWERDFAGTCQPATKEAKKELERLEKSCSDGEYWSKDHDKCISKCTRGKKWDSQTKSCVKEEENSEEPEASNDAWSMADVTPPATVTPPIEVTLDAVEGPTYDGDDGEVYDGPIEEDGTEGNSYTMNTTVRTNDNGNINETTDSSQFTITDGMGDGEGNGAPQIDLSDIKPVGLSGVTPPSATISDEELASLRAKTNKAQEEADAKKLEEELKQYTGLYNGRQILPDIMARHCRIKGEDVAKDVSLYVDCIKQYVSEMNSSNAAAKAKAQEEFEILRYKGLLDMASNAMTKSQSILNYENTMNEYNKADQDMQTEFDDNHALIATMSFMTDVMNSFRELQAEQLKYLAISGIVNVDPAVVLADEEEEEETKKPASTNGDAGDAEIHTTEATTKINQN